MDTFELVFCWFGKLKGKSLLDYAFFFLLTNKKEWKNDTKLFSTTKRLGWRKYIALFVAGIENSKILKHHTHFSFYHLL